MSQQTVHVVNGVAAPSLTQSPAATTARRLAQHHLDRLTKRAIDPALALAEGAQSLDEDEVRGALRNPKLTGGALGYWYGHLGLPLTDFTSYVRAYLDDPTANGKKVVCRAGLAPPPYFLTTATNHEGPWIVTESPEKALALASNGFAEAVGLGGVDAGMLCKADNQGHRALHPLAVRFIRPGHTTFIVMDAGRANNPRVARAEARLAKALAEHGCDVRLVALPLLPGDVDQGVDDFIACSGRQALAALFAAAVPGDTLARARGAVARGVGACEALLEDLPFVAALAEGGEAAVAGVEAALATLVPPERITAALGQYRARVRGQSILDRGDEVELGHELVTELGGRDVVAFDQGELHRYTNGVWVVVQRDEAKRVVAGYAGSSVRVGDKLVPLKLSDRGINGAVNLARAETFRKDFFSNAPRGLVFANGFARIERTEVVIEPHSANHRARHGYGFEYDPNAKASTFNEFLESVWEGDIDAEQKRAVLQEYIGAALFGLAARSKKILLLHGEGDTGKSTTINIVQGMFPPDSVVSIPPQQFRSDYHRARLAHALLNVVAEIQETEWMDPASFKALVGDDMMSGRSPYKDVITFRPVAGHVFGANGLPRINDRSSASWNRLLVLSYNRVFVRKGAPGNGPRARAGLAEAVLRDETPGVVAWAVAGLRRLLANGLSYTRVGTSEAAVAALRSQSDQLSAFFTEQCDLDADAREIKRLVYERYAQWARATNHAVLSSTMFGREFVPLLRRMTTVPDPTSSDHKGRPTYVGVRLRAIKLDEMPKRIDYSATIDLGYPVLTGDDERKIQ